MLEKIFGSRTRVKLFRLFFIRPDEQFFVREISRTIGEQINSVRRELNNLEDIGLLTSRVADKKKFYTVNKEFPLYNEMRSFMFKSRLTLEREFIQGVRQLGAVAYLALTGYFVSDQKSPIDVFVVGTVNRTRLQKLLEQFKETFHTQLRYTLMTREEYAYRKEVTDKFLYQMMNSDKIVLVDKLNS